MLEHVFPGNTEMAQRMRAFDWSATTLGPVEQWPPALRTSVSNSLDCAFPIVLWWGKDLSILYNDEYISCLGPAKHPGALGKPGVEVWSEIWDVVGPMLSSVVETAEATRSRDLMLVIERDGYPEETYFSFSYSPIHDDGNVSGIFCPVIETTEKVIGERRLRALRDLAASCKGAASERDACVAATGVLGENPFDVPFALLYRVADDGATAELCAAAGIEPGHEAAPERVPLAGGRRSPWSLGTVARSGRRVTLDDLAERWSALPAGAWKTPPHTALVLPVPLPGQERPHFILVAAVSPMRQLDDQYRTFYGLLADQISAGIADARALEEERRRVEALAQIDRAKTAFFSNVSHEFRTPLTLMMGPLEDALAGVYGELPEAAAGTLDVAYRNSRRLLKLVNTLLDFSRIEAGRVDACYELTDLTAVTAELASVFRSAIEKAGLALVIDCQPGDAPAFVDRDMWEKIVLNLLSNALKYTFDGTITVALRQVDRRFVLTVSDTGVGIPAADLPRVFERFHRVKDARSRTHEGTGIGLALVHELARLHGAEVSVASVEGQGTTFTITMPAGDAHLPADRIGASRRLPSTSISATPFLEEALRWLPGQESESRRLSQLADVQLPAPAVRGARVLIADDNADMRDYLSRLLSAAYEVTAVSDGEEALERIREAVPDLVLSDVMMPRRDGFSLLAAIRADERTRAMPVVLLSARAGEEARIEGLEAGADDYLIKPFSARELLARIGSQLELARLRRQSASELRVRSEQFETLINRAPLGVYLVDADFRIRQVNPVAAPVFGEIEGGVVGRDFDEIIHLLLPKDIADEVVGIFRHTLATGESYVADERARFRVDHGKTEYYEWRLERITLPDGRYGLVCYFRDISAFVAARRSVEESREALRAADRKKDEFLAMLAHELRNPLAPIRNALRVMRLSEHNGAVAERTVEMMERQVSHMVRLVDDLLEVSRITRGKIELRREPVDVASVVRSAIEASRPLIETARHLLMVELPDEPVMLNADPVRIAQVLSNLLNNAAKYTTEGGSIWLRVHCEEQLAVIAVRDSGAGIPPDALPGIFDLFAQVERTYDRAQGGLGIGLTLVRSLVQMHGGTVEARSQGVGLGSEFIVRLPLASQPAPLRTIGERHSPISVARNRILVVDDSHDAADSLELLLRYLGAEVCTAYDGPAALAALDTFRPNVVLLDIGLPGMDGFEVARRIRRHEGCGDVVLIALSGWGREEDRRRSRAAGIDHHFIKPVDPETLEQLLASLPTREAAALIPVLGG